MKKLPLLMLPLLFALSAKGQEKSSTFNFLKLPVSAHAAALGGMNVSVVDDDPTLAFTNPALLASVSDNTINLNYMSYLKGSTVASASYAKAVGERHTLGFNANFINYGSMDATDATGQTTGSLTAKDFSIGAQYSYSLSNSWVGGATMRFITSKYAEYSACALSFDLGLNYFDEDKDFSFGIAMRNIGAQLKKFDDHSEHLPFDIDLGISKGMEHAPVRFSLTMTDLTRWSSDYYYTEDGKKSSFGRILFNHFVIGVDVIPSENFYISAGYNARRASELKAAGSGHWAGFSLGGGLKLSKFKLGVSYARYHVAASSLLANISYNL
jgi:hypothetical protein